MANGDDISLEFGVKNGDRTVQVGDGMDDRVAEGDVLFAVNFKKFTTAE
ncbi:MAG: hypothetical protein WCD18_16020 [Thermosynechococcaceae cyanobacterium]